MKNKPHFILFFFILFESLSFFIPCSMNDNTLTFDSFVASSHGNVNIDDNESVRKGKSRKMLRFEMDTNHLDVCMMSWIEKARFRNILSDKTCHTFPFFVFIEWNEIRLMEIGRM